MDKKILMNITKLQLINWILQLLFFRVFKNIKGDGTIGYGIMYFVLPFTGWSSNFITLGKMKFYSFK